MGTRVQVAEADEKGPLAKASIPFGWIPERVTKGDVGIEIGPGLNPLGTPDAGYMVMNIDQARKELGFSPRYDLEAGTKDYIETLRRLDIRPM